MRNPNLPTIHLNGTSRDTLKAGYDRAADALAAAIQAFNSIEFNARDYYTQEPDGWIKAREQRDEMQRNLRAVHDYLEAHLFHLYT